MKRFITTVLTVSAVFIGLGAMIENVGAKFKSDEKALDIVRKARAAIGGDAAIAEVRSMTIAGRTTHTFKVDGAERSEQGETEIALQLPDKMVRTMRIGKDDGTGEKMINKQHDVVIVRKGDGEKMTLEGKDGEFTTADGKTISIRKTDGEKMKVEGKDGEITTADGKTFTITRRVDGEAKPGSDDVHKVMVRKVEGAEGGAVWHSKDGEKVKVEGQEMVFSRSAHPGADRGLPKQNELLRTTLALLLTAPEGLDVNYTFVGEKDVDGVAANIISAEFGGAVYKLYIGKSTNLPLAMSYSGQAMPHIVRFTAEAPADGAKETRTFTKKLDVDTGAESFVRFTEYRTTNGVQLPYRWTTTTGSGPAEVFDVTSYEINPANIAEKFANQKVFVRSPKPTN